MATPSRNAVNKPSGPKSVKEPRARLGHNVVPKLLQREVNGKFQRYSHSKQFPVFNKLPGRLGFRLSSLLDESTLQDGYVFLGFTKDGQFVLSYTQSLEVEDHTAYPVYVYKLQWWRFIPHRRLRQCAEVRLFGEEEIQHDLYLAVCQWPTQSSQILVYGYCVTNTEEEKKQCHITITAAPSLVPCEECNKCYKHATHLDLPVSSKKCVQHSFVVHTKYELAPPYPSFAPLIFMKLDGVVMFNTGDSLVALSVELGAANNLRLFSPEDRDEYIHVLSPRSSLSSYSHEDPITRHGALKTGYNSMVDDCYGRHDISPRSYGSGEDRSRPFSSPVSPYANNLTPQHLNDPYSPSNITSDSESDKPVDYKPRSRMVELRTTLASISNNVRAAEDLQMNLPELNNTLAESTRHEDHVTLPVDAVCSGSEIEDQENLCATQLMSDKSVGTDSAPIMRKHLDCGREISITPSGIKSHKRDPYDFENSPDPCRATGTDCLGEFPTPNILLRVHHRPPRLDINREISISLPAPLTRPDSSMSRQSFELGRDICLSPSTTDAFSTCSSCLNSPLVLHNDSQCFTYSIRQYYEREGEEEAVIDMDDDPGMAYNSVLPVQVHGSCYRHMGLCNSSTLDEKPRLTVRQLTLDVEQYIGETIRTQAEWSSRYVALTDYDIQILDVCPETCSVIAMVLALVRAKPYPRQEHRCRHNIKSSPRLYQTGFKFVWNLTSGAYTTIDIDDLMEYNMAQLKGKDWNPCHDLCVRMQRLWKVPQSQVKSVNVLTNDSVFRGKSLRVLLDTLNYVAILL